MFFNLIRFKIIQASSAIKLILFLLLHLMVIHIQPLLMDNIQDFQRLGWTCPNLQKQTES